MRRFFAAVREAVIGPGEEFLAPLVALDALDAGLARVRAERDWPWALTLIHDQHKRLFASELAAEWGEAMWTAPDLWRVRP